MFAKYLFPLTIIIYYLLFVNSVVYYRCYCPILVTERGWKRVWRIGFFNCIHRSRCNLSLHLQVARWIFPSVTSTKKGGAPPSFFVCVKTCHTLVSFVTYYITQFTIICKWLVIVIKKQGCRPAFSFCVNILNALTSLPYTTWLSNVCK